jgi:hypothetical protein
MKAEATKMTKDFGHNQQAMEKLQGKIDETS